MKLTNLQIYNYAEELYAQFKACNITLPVKLNFFLQKNIRTIEQAVSEIQQARLSIASTFGILNEEGYNYIIPPENVAQANRELNDLFSIEQELNIHMFNLSEFDNIELTYQQMAAIMFMIEED